MGPFEPAPGDERLTTAIVSDALDEAGFRHQVLERRLAPLVPGSRVFGRAATVRFVPDERDVPADPYAAAIDFVDSLEPGQVVVIATEEANASAVWGELFSTAAIGAGAVGVLTDGALRDTARIAALGFPAFSRSRRPIDYRRRLAIAQTRGTVRIGGVPITHADLVIADDDGAVVIPQHAEEAVLRIARLRASGESTVLAELLAGESLRTVWDRHRIL